MKKTESFPKPKAFNSIDQKIALFGASLACFFYIFVILHQEMPLMAFLAKTFFVFFAFLLLSFFASLIVRTILESYFEAQNPKGQNLDLVSDDDSVGDMTSPMSVDPESEL